MRKNVVGMTLVEVLIATVLLILVSLAAGLVYTSGYRLIVNKGSDINRSTSKVYIVRHMAKHLRQAQKVDLPSASQITFWDNGKTASYNWDPAGKTIVYKSDISSGSQEIIADKILSLVFSISDNLRIHVKYSISHGQLSADNQEFDILPRIKAANINIYRSP